MCIDYEDYLEKRAKLEKDYSEGLAKLVKGNAGKDEIGTLRASWDKIKKETEAVSQLHIELSQKLNEALANVKDFRNKQKEIRKKMEDTVKKAAQHKKNCYEKNNKSRANYESKCKEADRTEEQYNRLQANRQTKPKDLIQTQKKLEGAKQAASSADTAYLESVKALEESRQLWEREMEVLCQKFQELEEQRITFLRNEMWTYSNLNSQNLVQIDEAYESIRKTLEECDVDQDIDLFVHERATGMEKPASIPYINYYNSQTLPGTQGVRSMDPSSIISPPAHAFKELPPLPDDSGANTTSAGVYAAVNETDTSTYSVPSVHTDGLVIAVFAYEAQGDQELGLEEGDIITVVSKEDDVWWCGRIGDRSGMFPVAYVEPYSAQTGTSQAEC